jgi:hypothetical protein
MPYVRKTATLYISEELRDILKKIENQSKVASMLLRKRHKVEDMTDGYINFIGVSKSDKTKLSYLTEERMKNMEPSDYWTSSRRYQIKPGGLVGKVFKGIHNSDVECFSNAFRAQLLMDKINFKVVEGEDIRKYYHYSTYNDESSSLGSSCMKYERCQKFLDIYVKNTGLISMVLMLNEDNMLLGRALLWKNDDFKVMDRIYTENDEMLVPHFKNWADKNGFMYKKNQNWHTTQVFINKGREEVHQISFNVTGDYSYYPYFDTFKFYDEKSGTLSNFNIGNEKIKTLCSPEGSWCSHDYLLEDEIDRNYYYHDDVVTLDYCNLSVNRNKCHWSEINECYIYREDAIFEDTLRDYIFGENFDMLNSKSIREKIESIMKKKEEKYQFINMDTSPLWTRFIYDTIEVRREELESQSNNF